MAENFKTYNIEMANCEYLAHRQRSEETRLDEGANRAKKIKVLIEVEAKVAAKLIREQSASVLLVGRELVRALQQVAR